MTSRPYRERTDRVATVARMYDYYLGGLHNFPADQRAAQEVIERLPHIPAAAHANRAFLARAVGVLAGAGVRQFLDIGAGIPTQGSVQYITASAVDARAVFVDIDPCAVAETLELLEGSSCAAAIRGDLRDPEAILGHREVRRLLDFTRPIGLLLTGVLPFVLDDAEAADAVGHLVAALPSGSQVAISHAATEVFPSGSEACEAAAQIYQEYTTAQATARDRAGVERFFAGLRLTAPGVVCAGQWHPDPARPVPASATEPSGHSGLWVGLGTKP